MARIRKFVAYRRLERPYTRRSKYQEKSYIRANPHSKIVRFDMGDKKSNFPCRVSLVVRDAVQIRHNALESSRLTCNRFLERKLGKAGYYFKLRIFPHHMLRENPLASGAGADRLSTGMKMSFGKVIGSAAQLRQGQELMDVFVPKDKLAIAKEGLRKASHKLPCGCMVIVKE